MPNLNRLYSKMLGGKCCGCNELVSQVRQFSPVAGSGALITFGCCDACGEDPEKMAAIREKVMEGV